jgi:hypothetical protein
VSNTCTIVLFNPTAYFKRQHVQAILSSRSSNASPSTSFLKCDNRRRCAETGVPWCAFLFANKFPSRPCYSTSSARASLTNRPLKKLGVICSRRMYMLAPTSVSATCTTLRSSKLRDRCSNNLFSGRSNNRLMNPESTPHTSDNPVGVSATLSPIAIRTVASFAPRSRPDESVVQLPQQGSARPHKLRSYVANQREIDVGRGLVRTCPVQGKARFWCR